MLYPAFLQLPPTPLSKLHGKRLCWNVLLNILLLLLALLFHVPLRIPACPSPAAAPGSGALGMESVMEKAQSPSPGTGGAHSWEQPGYFWAEMFGGCLE